MRRVWKCAKCRKQFSRADRARSSTARRSRSSTGSRSWCRCAPRRTASAPARSSGMHGVTPETAWFMLHRLREAMKRDPLVGMLSRRRRRRRDLHRRQAKEQAPARAKRPPIRYDGGASQAQRRTRRRQDRRPVAGRPQRPARSAPRVDPRRHRRDACARPSRSRSTWPNTDAAHRRAAGPTGSSPASSPRHESSTTRPTSTSATRTASRHHQPGRGLLLAAEAVASTARTTTSAREHLHRYLAEFDFRYSTRKLSDSDRLQKMVDQAEGRRLTYKPLTGQ